MEKERFEKINEEYIKIAKKYDLNPTLLKEIIFLNAHGYNHIQVASRMGVSRVTVGKYLGRLRETNDEDFLNLIFRVSFILGKTYHIKGLIKEYNNPNNL